MLKIYHVTGTRSVRTLWLVKELGLAHTTVSMPFDPQVMHGEDYLRINPLGKVPTIDDEGFVLTESGAITQYLLAKYGEGRLEPSPRPPPGSPGHGRFLQWLYFPEATMMPHLGVLVRQRRMAEDRRDQVTIDHALGKAAETLAFSDTALGSTPYVLGAEFTAADIMLGYSLSLADRLGVVEDRYPAIRTYLTRLLERPAFRAALAA
jgi:glutathione S-transferase